MWGCPSESLTLTVFYQVCRFRPEPSVWPGGATPARTVCLVRRTCSSGFEVRGFSARPIWAFPTGRHVSQPYFRKPSSFFTRKKEKGTGRVCPSQAHPRGRIKLRGGNPSGRSGTARAMKLPNTNGQHGSVRLKIKDAMPVFLSASFGAPLLLP